MNFCTWLFWDIYYEGVEGNSISWAEILIHVEKWKKN